MLHITVPSLKPASFPGHRLQGQRVMACHGPGVMAESTSYRYKTIINLTPAQTGSVTANTPTLYFCSRDKYGYDYHSCRIKAREKLAILMTICHKTSFDTIMTCPTHNSRNEQCFEILQATNHQYVQTYIHRPPKVWHHLDHRRHARVLIPTFEYLLNCPW